jgi:hypothetical protein
MIVAVLAGQFGATLVEQARENRVAAKADARAAGRMEREIGFA